METEQKEIDPKALPYPPWRNYRPIKVNVFTHREPKNIPASICNCIPPGKHRPCCEDERCLNFAMRVECPDTCNGKKGCRNQRMQKTSTVPLRVAEAGQKGWGLFAERNLKAREFIIEYVGEVINHKEMERRKIKYVARDKFKDRKFKVYFMQLNANEFLDARKMGGVARFINHSCDPNCVTQKWKVDGEERVGVFALRDILEGTELCFDYGWKLLSYADGSTTCHCGTSLCKGTVETVPPRLENPWTPIPAAVPTMAIPHLTGIWREPDPDTENGLALVERRVRVYWEGNLQWFQGEVMSFDKESAKHQILYTDGTDELLDLSQTKWEILDQEKEVFKIAKKAKPGRKNTISDDSEGDELSKPVASSVAQPFKILDTENTQNAQNPAKRKHYDLEDESLTAVSQLHRSLAHTTSIHMHSKDDKKDSMPFEEETKTGVAPLESSACHSDSHARPRALPPRHSRQVSKRPLIDQQEAPQTRSIELADTIKTPRAPTLSPKRSLAAGTTKGASKQPKTLQHLRSINPKANRRSDEKGIELDAILNPQSNVALARDTLQKQKTSTDASQQSSRQEVAVCTTAHRQKHPNVTNIIEGEEERNKDAVQCRTPTQLELNVISDIPIPEASIKQTGVLKFPKKGILKRRTVSTVPSSTSISQDVTPKAQNSAPSKSHNSIAVESFSSQNKKGDTTEDTRNLPAPPRLIKTTRPSDRGVVSGPKGTERASYDLDGALEIKNRPYPEESRFLGNKELSLSNPLPMHRYASDLDMQHKRRTSSVRSHRSWQGGTSSEEEYEGNHPRQGQQHTERWQVETDMLAFDLEQDRRRQAHERGPRYNVPEDFQRKSHLHEEPRGPSDWKEPGFPRRLSDNDLESKSLHPSSYPATSRPARNVNLPKHLVPCMFFLQNACKYGNSCHYNHGDRSLETTNESMDRTAGGRRETEVEQRRTSNYETSFASPALQRMRSAPPSPPIFRGKDYDHFRPSEKPALQPRYNSPASPKAGSKELYQARSSSFPSSTSHNRVPLELEQQDHFHYDTSIEDRNRKEFVGARVAGEPPRKRMFHGPGSDRSESSSRDDPLEVNMVVPTETVPHLIGKNGRCIMELRDASGAKLTICPHEGDEAPEETRVLISGKPNQVLHAKALIKDTVAWAMTCIETSSIAKGSQGKQSLASGAPVRQGPTPIPAETDGGDYVQPKGFSSGDEKVPRQRRQRIALGIDWYSFPKCDSMDQAGSNTSISERKSAIRFLKEVARELQASPSVVLHGSVLLHRYCSLRLGDVSKLNFELEDMALACLHLANKCQKVQAERRLSKLLSAALRAWATERSSSAQYETLQEKVLEAEGFLLVTSQFDVSFPDAWIMLRLMTQNHPLLESQLAVHLENLLLLSCYCTSWLHYPPKVMLASVVVVAVGLIMFLKEEQDPPKFQELVAAVHSHIVQGLMLAWGTVRESADSLAKGLIEMHGKRIGALDMGWVLETWDEWLGKAAASSGARGELVSRLGSAQAERNALALLPSPLRLQEQMGASTGILFTEHFSFVKKLSTQLVLASVDISLLEEQCEGLPRFFQQAQPTEAALPHADRMQVYLLKWPSERVESPATGSGNVGGADSQVPGSTKGFSPVALQELAMLQFLHTLCANPTSGPPMVTPIAPVVGKKLRCDYPALLNPLEEQMSHYMLDDGDPTLDQSEFEKESYLMIEPCPHIFLSVIRAARSAPLPWRVVQHMLRGLLDAVRYCHDRNVVLRVIDVERIFISGQGVVKFAGLSSAMSVFSTSLSTAKQQASVAPTTSTDNINRKVLVCRAPELLLGKKHYSVASDMWAVGIIACQLVLGQPLIQAKDLAQHMEYLYRICGSPADDNWPEGKEMPFYEKFKPQHNYKPRLEKAICSSMRPSAGPKTAGPEEEQLANFIASLLRLDPAQRCSAREALFHECLRSSPSNEMQPEEIISWMNEHVSVETFKPTGLADVPHPREKLPLPKSFSR